MNLNHSSKVSHEFLVFFLHNFLENQVFLLFLFSLFSFCVPSPRIITTTALLKHPFMILGLQEAVDIFLKVEDFWKKHPVEEAEEETEKAIT